MAGGVIAYRFKTQPITAQNVSEAEMVAANAAGKVIQYLQMVLNNLGLPVQGPSPIWEDNVSVIKIFNHDRPTPPSRHIVIRYFCLQQWCELAKLILIHISGKIKLPTILPRPSAGCSMNVMFISCLVTMVFAPHLPPLALLVHNCVMHAHTWGG